MAYHKIKCCPYLLYDHSVLAILTLVNMYFIKQNLSHAFNDHKQVLLQGLPTVWAESGR